MGSKGTGAHWGPRGLGSTGARAQLGAQGDWGPLGPWAQLGAPGDWGPLGPRAQQGAPGDGGPIGSPMGLGPAVTGAHRARGPNWELKGIGAHWGLGPTVRSFTVFHPHLCGGSPLLAAMISRVSDLIWSSSSSIAIWALACCCLFTWCGTHGE